MMKGEWCYYESRFTPEQCDMILTEGLKLPVKGASLGVSGNNEDNSYRRSQIRFIEKNNSDFGWLFDEMWKMAIEANDLWFGFHISKLDYIQLAEYDESYQGEYKAHHDIFWMNNDPVYHRKLTAVVQLTDPSLYEGGNLEMLQLEQYPSNPDKIRQRGTTFFFPSFLQHQATPVTKGKRYSLACWFDGPKWR